MEKVNLSPECPWSYNSPRIIGECLPPAPFGSEWFTSWSLASMNLEMVVNKVTRMESCSTFILHLAAAGREMQLWSHSFHSSHFTWDVPRPPTVIAFPLGIATDPLLQPVHLSSCSPHKEHSHFERHVNKGNSFTPHPVPSMETRRASRKTRINTRSVTRANPLGRLPNRWGS